MKNRARVAGFFTKKYTRAMGALAALWLLASPAYASPVPDIVREAAEMVQIPKKAEKNPPNATGEAAPSVDSAQNTANPPADTSEVAPIGDSAEAANSQLSNQADGQTVDATVSQPTETAGNQPADTIGGHPTDANVNQPTYATDNQTAEGTGDYPANTADSQTNAADNQSPDNTDGQPANAGVANPMLEYPDVRALERTVGFPVYYLPGNLYAFYHPADHIYSINDLVTDIRFTSKADDSTLTVRTALIERVHTEDLSGYYGEWKETTAGDVKRSPVNIAKTEEGMYIARWTKGRFAFAFTIKGVDEATFQTMVKNFVQVSDKFAHKYQNFSLNTARMKRRMADATNASPAGAEEEQPQKDSASQDAPATDESTSGAEVNPPDAKQ